MHQVPDIIKPHVEPERVPTPVDRGFYLYFDTLMLAPRGFKEAELCFCVQKNHTVCAYPKPGLVKM